MEAAILYAFWSFAHLQIRMRAQVAINCRHHNDLRKKKRNMIGYTRRSATICYEAAWGRVREGFLKPLLVGGCGGSPPGFFTKFRAH